MEKIKDGSGRGLIRIAIVGPESTGKSVLSEQLAKHYDTEFVKEVAREFIAKLNRKYTIDDIIKISQLQITEENAKAGRANKILFCDTNLLVTKIWAEHSFGVCPEWIFQNFHPGNYDLHLLTGIDLPWEPDPQREHPHLRKQFFDLYKSSLTSLNVPFSIVNGS